jgi:hypothetical protein
MLPPPRLRCEVTAPAPDGDGRVTFRVYSTSRRLGMGEHVLYEGRVHAGAGLVEIAMPDPAGGPPRFVPAEEALDAGRIRLR